jgi:hypothetical protein
MYLKEQNPAIRTLGVDAYGSILKKYKETGEMDMTQAYSYLVEGIGQDIIPGNFDFDYIVGNPPFGGSIDPKNDIELEKKYGIRNDIKKLAKVFKKKELIGDLKNILIIASKYEKLSI